jgi:hypothetical protein
MKSNDLTKPYPSVSIFAYQAALLRFRVNQVIIYERFNHLAEVCFDIMSLP